MSLKICNTSINIDAIATIPKSSGFRTLARIRVAISEKMRLEKLNSETQPKPLVTVRVVGAVKGGPFDEADMQTI
jgi:hypothetical protein